MRRLRVSIAALLLAGSGASIAQAAPDAAAPVTPAVPADPANAAVPATPATPAAPDTELAQAEGAAPAVEQTAPKKKKPRRKPPSQMTGAKGWF